ncbi:ADP-ribosylation factor-related protein 1 [Hordeum vulgare]|nr:ADP-ribosylation factor-related protein 1 [Hordeum vulgare]
MGLWNYGRKGTHDREAGSSSGRRRGSIKEEAASPPRQAAASLSIAPRPGTGYRDRQYLSVEVCRRYSETRTPVPWSDVHLPNAWLLSADRVPIPPVPTSGHARREEIDRRRRLLPDDLYYDPRYVADSTLWDTWLRDKHDVRRASYFVGTVAVSWQARLVRGRTRVLDITPTPSPSPSPSPPPPPRMTEEQEARLIQRVMKDSVATHDERQWPGLDHAMALSAAGDVAILEPKEEEEVAAFPVDLVGALWGWSCSAPEMARAVEAVNWCPTGAGGLATGGVDRTVPPPPLVVCEEDQSAKVAYQAAHAVVYRESEEDEWRRAMEVEQEEAEYKAATSDFVLPRITPPSLVKA